MASGTTRRIASPSTGTKPSRAVNGSLLSSLVRALSRNTSDATSGRRCSVSAVATTPPIEWPMMVARRTSRRSRAAATRRACSSIP